MSSSKESSGSESAYVNSIKSLPEFYPNPSRYRRTSIPGSRYSDSTSLFTRPLSVSYKTERTTTGLFKKKTTIVDSGSFIKENG